MSRVDPSFVRNGLIQRGMPEYLADAFTMNAGDESNFDPGINEIAPLVPGSKGGFGFFQWTGPRRRAYEAFAAQRGVNPADGETQLDFLMTELQGPEVRAARSIFAAPDTASAAVAIARDFLRPAPENLAKRVARYAGQQAPNFPAGGNAPQNALMAAGGQQTAPQGQQNALAAPQAPQMVDTRLDVRNFLTARPQPQQQMGFEGYLRNYLS